MVSGEKRNCEENVLERINTILLDIEGTTTSISFVKDTLFPYIRENLKTYIDSHWNDDEFKADLKALKEQAKKDEEDKVDNFCPIEEGEKEKESLIKNILWQMDADKKNTALKQLQGHIWREGYESGKLKGHVYSEVEQVFKKWCEEGRKLYIYSSGSKEAQKLLFKNSECGDLQGYLSGYFDTETGPKTEASSYVSIAKSVDCDCNQILFLTDVVKEAVAADKAGLQVMIVIREGNAPLTDDEKKAFSTITSFKDIVFETSNKKKKIEEAKVESEAAKTENDEKMEESVDIKNGEDEKMEVESTELKPEDCTEETKTEDKVENKESGERKTETNETSTKGESENVPADVDGSNVGKDTEEKVVSSSNNEESEEKKESSNNGVTEEQSAEKETEKVDSTNETPGAVSDNNVETESKGEETKEEEEMEEKKAEVEKEENGEKEEKNEKSVNGHENGDVKADNENEEENDKEASGEVTPEANGKLEEELETVPVKKVEEQADSTVEVTA